MDLSGNKWNVYESVCFDNNNRCCIDTKYEQYAEIAVNNKILVLYFFSYQFIVFPKFCVFANNYNKIYWRPQILCLRRRWSINNDCELNRSSHTLQIYPIFFSWIFSIGRSSEYLDANDILHIEHTNFFFPVVMVLVVAVFVVVAVFGKKKQQ